MRVYCKYCNQVLTEAVPWAFRESTFTKDFEKSATFLAGPTHEYLQSSLMQALELKFVSTT